MAIEEALTALLADVAGGRVYWGRAEGISPSDGAYLRLVWISGPRDYNLAGPSGYVRGRLQADVFAETYTAARDAAVAARAALSGYRGDIANTRIMGIFVDNEDDSDASDAGEVSHLFRRRIDYIIHYSEAA